MLLMESLQAVKVTSEWIYLYRKHRGGKSHRKVLGINIILSVLHDMMK